VTKYELDPDTDVEALHAFLNQKFTVELKDGDVSTVLDVYRSEREKILSFIEGSGLFPVPEDHAMQIMMTPGFLQPVIPAVAMWPPLALREGARTSLVLLTLKEQEMDEHTHLGIGTMMIHEGIPGHHLQFASASLQKSLIRRIFDAAEHAEGWTTMLEDYMLDIGYFDAELNWYSTQRGYPLSYLTGNRLVWELKRDIARVNLKQLDDLELDREFHRIYLQSGCMPVASLRRVFEHEGLL
jgi:uncharacterized protein (DUF885 family)